MYAAILGSAALHLVAVTLLLGISALFWRSVFTTAQARPAASLAVLLFTMGHTGFLGAWLTFGARPWYPFLDVGAALWGLTLLEDQQLAGLFMWVLGGAAYLLAGLAVVARALQQPGGIRFVDSRPRAAGPGARSTAG